MSRHPSAARAEAIRIIAGRDRVTTDDAWHCFGRWGEGVDPARVHSAYHVEVAADGTVAAADVLHQMSIRRARVLASIRNPRFEADVEFPRLQCDDTWLVKVDDRSVGNLELATFSTEALAFPSTTAGAWMCSTGDDRGGFAAISPRVAAFLLARDAGMLVSVDSETRRARRFTTPDALAELQRVAAEKDAGAAPSSDLLTPQEIQQMETRRTVAGIAWDQALRIGGSDPGEEFERQRRFIHRTDPDPTTLPLMGCMSSAQWTISAVAQRCGVLPDTVRGWRSKGMLPEPDGRVEQTMWWWHSTIGTWMKANPQITEAH